MIETKIILGKVFNWVWILLVILWTRIIFKNSPINIDSQDGWSTTTDREKIEKDTNVKNKKMRTWVFIIILWSIFQFISLFS